MRAVAASVLVLTVTACAQPAEPEPQLAPTAQAPANLAVNPARIDRARDGLPAGYEVAPYPGAPTPFATWGFRETAVSDPPPCAALGAPALEPASARGWSASGEGGIVFAVVATTTAPGPEPALIADCGHWTVTSGNTSGTVTALPAPEIEAAQTTGMSTTAITVVEGDTETHSAADTFVAYLGGHVCFVSVITDPGSPHPSLGADYAAHLLATTVATLRG